MRKLSIFSIYFSIFATIFCGSTGVWLLTQGDYFPAFVQFCFAVANGFMAKYNSDNLGDE